MESLRAICEREVPIELQKIDSFTASVGQSLDSINSIVEQTLQNQGKLGKMKSSLREAEDEFVKVLAVKTRKEAKQMAIRDSISATRARVEELKRTVQVQRAKRDEYATIISHQSIDKGNQGIEHKEEIQEALSWYNKVLGFYIEGGRGVKFTFNNINMRNPYEEYTFTVRHENDTYTLLACDPHLNDTKELINELNKTNGLFKFVRTMREKFQEVASLGILPQSTSLHQESATISVSAPVLSVSTERSVSPMKENEHSYEVKKQSKKINLGRGANQALLSPRRSPRFVKIKLYA
ncbi:kinetochore protein SPC25 homolog isoform X1 [Ricinus communis]|uniref:kinetochore protein SPC25 homolog isoform X1 n=1 Tax=Ricinus communis TaxID=3988 RepID=UPI0007721C2A|nr:kinetochore protein SPC25 homolog isoform X1 [Ricinus communis]|eukprot:XP_015578725.1 probable kinetochore protein SPC25 isoform X1 [Ricinus communis]